MTDSWRSRAYTVGEAATLSGIRRATLDVWCIRQPAELFSEKRGSRRWFSPRDICLLRLARELERGGMVLLTAIATAFEHLEQPPAPEAVFVIENGTVSPRAGRMIAESDVPRLRIEESIQLIPVGRMAAEIEAACAELRKRAA